MVTILSGVGLLLVTLAVFSIFSLKMPKGSLAMGGMADAAVATFLVEAIHKYISGDLIGIAFLREVGDISGSMGGVAAATLVPIAMGANPLFAVVAGSHPLPVDRARHSPGYGLLLAALRAHGSGAPRRSC